MGPRLTSERVTPRALPGPVRLKSCGRAGERSAAVLVLLAVLTIASPGSLDAQSVGDASSGQARYLPCQGCHGPAGEGNKLLNAPPLAGQDAWYVARQLRSFQAGSRGYDPRDVFGQQMKGMAALVPDEQAIADVASYLASLPGVPQESSVEGDAEAGRELFGVCAQCHGAAGEGRTTMNAPRIAGLPDWYVVRQLSNFLDRTRGEHPQDPYGVQMRPMVRAILADPTNRQPLNDVAAYMNSLR